MNSTYLSLLKDALTASLYPESSWQVLVRNEKGFLKEKLRNFIIDWLRSQDIVLVRRLPFNLEVRLAGEDWPMFGYSMIGHLRLDNIYQCIKSAIESDVPGDFVECGVWRGGASIFARAVLNELREYDRIVWLADSFEGMPAQSEQDRNDPAITGNTYLAVSLEDVRRNFDRFGLMSGNVKFIKGWFCDTLARSEVGAICVLRLDGDYYNSTMDALEALYDRVSDGGYIIIDDYYSFTSCKAAVQDFLRKRSLSPGIIDIDKNGVYWKKDPATGWS
jgi:O-methyltransferase